MLAPLAERFASQRSIEIKRFSGEVLKTLLELFLCRAQVYGIHQRGSLPPPPPPSPLVANDTLLQKLAPKYLTENSFATCLPLL